MKKSSYQKLKAENEKLLNDIRILVTEPESMSAIEINALYTMRFEQESIILAGSPSRHKLNDIDIANVKNNIEHYVQRFNNQSEIIKISY
jgi:hypothetical protein